MAILVTAFIIVLLAAISGMTEMWIYVVLIGIVLTIALMVEYKVQNKSITNIDPDKISQDAGKSTILTNIKFAAGKYDKDKK